MVGEGEYNLNALREIRVTKSFLEMQDKDRGCQIVETIQDCSTRHYIDSLTKECSCIPLSLQLFEKVCLIWDDWTTVTLLLYIFSLGIHTSLYILFTTWVCQPNKSCFCSLFATLQWTNNHEFRKIRWKPKLREFDPWQREVISECYKVVKIVSGDGRFAPIYDICMWHNNETSTSNPFLCAADFFLQLGSCKEAVR